MNPAALFLMMAITMAGGKSFLAPVNNFKQKSLKSMVDK